MSETVILGTGNSRQSGPNRGAFHAAGAISYQRRIDISVVPIFPNASHWKRTRAKAAVSLSYGRRGTCPKGDVTAVGAGSGVWFGLPTISKSRNERITELIQPGLVRKVRRDVPGRMNSSG